jgi:hypothetical protein
MAFVPIDPPKRLPASHYFPTKNQTILFTRHNFKDTLSGLPPIRYKAAEKLTGQDPI